MMRSLLIGNKLKNKHPLGSQYKEITKTIIKL